MSLSEAVGWAQVLLAIAAIAAVLVSIVVSNLTLREVRKDRRAGAMPVVVFDPGGHHLPVTFEKAGRAIPGVNPAYVVKVLPERFEAGESVRLDWSKLGEHYGELRNLGRGAALSIDVTWIPERVTIGSDSFEVDDQKRQEPIYGKALNQMPPWQSHLSAGGSTGLTRLPTFVEKDIDHKLTEATGRLRISFKDVFGSAHVVHQGFFLATSYDETPMAVHITFGDIAPLRD